METKLLSSIKARFLFLFVLIFVFFLPILYSILITKIDISESSTYHTVLNIFFLIGEFAFLFVVIIEFVSPFIVSDASFVTAIMALGIFLSFLFGNDGILALNYVGTNIDISDNIINSICHILSFSFYLVGIIAVYYFFVTTYGVSVNKREIILSFVVLVLSHLAYIALAFFGYEFIPFFVTIFLIIYWIVRISILAIGHEELNSTFVTAMLITILFSSYMFSETLANNALFNFSDLGVGSYLLIIILVLFFLIYLFFVYRTSKEAFKKEQYEKQLNSLQTNILKNQMSPHFTFNALNAIKSLYAIDRKNGDRAIDLLSKILRGYVNAKDQYLTTFENEIDIIASFIELTNLRIKKPFEIIYDIDVYDFSIPYFSIETLIENTVNYSKVNEKEDGYILISSEYKDNGILLKIIDNGVGFDVQKIKNTSYGIKNSKEQIELLLKGTFNIKSRINEGTEITIFIPNIEK